MEKEDDDLDDLLDEALNDFEREETKQSEKPPPSPAAAMGAAGAPFGAVGGTGLPGADEMQREMEQTLDAMQLPPEMADFRKALLESFSSMAALATGPSDGAAAAGGAGEGAGLSEGAAGEGDAMMVESFLKGQSLCVVVLYW